MLGAEAREANKAWLMQQVNHVLEPLMLEIVREKPENTVSIASICHNEDVADRLYGQVYGTGVWGESP